MFYIYGFGSLLVRLRFDALVLFSATIMAVLYSIVFATPDCFRTTESIDFHWGAGDVRGLLHARLSLQGSL